MFKKIKWLAGFYRPFPGALVILLLLTPIHAAVFMVQPIILKYIFDLVEEGQATLPSHLQFLLAASRYLELGEIAGAALMWFIFGAVLLVLYIFLQGTRAWMNIRLEWAFRQQAFNAATGKGPDFFNKFRTGDLLTRMTDDVAEKLSWFACSGIWRFFEALCLVAFGLVMMVSLNPKLTLYTAAPLPLLVIIFMKTASLLQTRFDRLQKKISALNNVIESCFSGIRVVKAYNRQRMWRGKFADSIGERRNAEIDAVKSWAMIESLYWYVPQLGIIAVLLAGGYMAIYGDVTIGDFVAFESYVFFLVFPMFDIGHFLVKGRQSAVSIGRLMEIEKYPPMVPENGKKNGKVEFAAINFNRVSFKFDDGDRELVNGIEFRAGKGETIALVGKVGSGKSWVINLLTRLADPTDGDIRLDNRPLIEIPLESYRAIMGYVPQEPILFSGTIEENIRFGNGDLDADRLNQVIKLAQLDSLIENSADGVKTKIGVRGLNVSGGEKQRISIARALVRDPRILLLDDCTSALDADTEERLWDSLEKVMPEMTCFIVTHRPKTLRRASQILLFDEGRIIARGTHDDLLTSSEVYCELYSRSELKEQVGAE